MGLFFDDPLHETFAANVVLGTVSRGGAEPGEIIATCARITDGDDDSWYDEWCATADHVAAAGRAAAAAGHTVSAREALLRASSYYGTAFRTLFGAPVDERLVAAFAGQRAAFEAAVGLLDVPGEAFTADVDGATVPGWFFGAPGATLAPLLVATNGYDMGMPDLYLGVAASALRRGYHCAIFDGPGQGRMLVEQGVTMRADWEQVVTPVLDVVLERPEVDTDRVALMGWSLGGYLALRAATAEPRLAACIADPGLYGIRESLVGRLRALQVPDPVIAGLPELPADILAALEQFVGADRLQHWSLAQRGFWVHGVDSFAGYVRAAYDFSLAGRLDRITCPTLVTAADADPLSSTAHQVLADLVSSSAELAQFTADEGAGDHCEWRNRARFDQRAFDWLDEQLAGDG